MLGADLDVAVEEECHRESPLFPSNGAREKARRPGRRLEMSGWKTKESIIGRRTEMARRNVELDEIREMGRGEIGCRHDLGLAAILGAAVA